MAERGSRRTSLGIVLIVMAGALLGLGCLCNAALPILAPRLIDTLLRAGDLGFHAVRVLSPLLRPISCAPVVLGLVLLVVGVVVMIVSRQREAVPEAPRREPAPPAPLERAAKTCSSCGAENAPDNVFCERCGTRLE
jgi:hypothetical protein